MPEPVPVKLRVFLDTSVFSAYHDDRVPDRRAHTERFWERRKEFELGTSALAREELAFTPDPTLRARLLALLDDVTVHPMTGGMQELARQYVAEGVFGQSMFNDAVHVAAAVLTEHDVLLSWNFQHLVNRRRRSEVNKVNVALTLPAIEILAPPEL